MAFPLTLQIFDELLATIAKLYWNVPLLASNARAQSGDPLFRDAWRQFDVHVRRVRGIQQLFGAIRLAWYFPSLGSSFILEPLAFAICTLVNTWM
jgi:hypothetical protein